MRVRIKWLKSPISYGFAKSRGDYSLIDKKLADTLSKKDPNLFEVEKPIEVKDTMIKKTRIRPVTRED